MYIHKHIYKSTNKDCKCNCSGLMHLERTTNRIISSRFEKKKEEEEGVQDEVGQDQRLNGQLVAYFGLLVLVEKCHKLSKMSQFRILLKRH